jgi:hypothetical protein
MEVGRGLVWAVGMVPNNFPNLLLNGVDHEACHMKVCIVVQQTVPCDNLSLCFVQLVNFVSCCSNLHLLL